MRRRRRVPRRRALRLPPSVRSAAVGSHNRYRARAASGSLRTGFWSHAPTPVPVSVNLAPGPQVKFLCPGAALLMVQRPVSLRDGVDVQQAVRATLIGQIGHLRQKPFARNPAVDHDMRDMDPFGSELPGQRSEEHTSELQSLMRISYAVFCLKKKKTTTTYTSYTY